MRHLAGDKIPVPVESAQFIFHSSMAMLRVFREEDIPERELLEDYERRIPKPPELAEYGID